MSKLLEWVSLVTSILALWLAVFFEKTPFDMSTNTKNVLLISPVLLGIGFAIFSAAVIAYRVATFNDCVDASKELQKQIQEAKDDLTKKGFEFSS